MTAYWDQFRDTFAGVLRGLANSLGFLGSHRWAAAIILLTLIVRTLLLPLQVKQIRSSQAMQRLQPELKRLQAKFKNDKQKLNQEMMELYKRESINPFASCLPLVAQMPVFFAMFWAIREVSKTPGIKMPFLGLGSLTVPAIDSWAGRIFLVIMTVTGYFSSRQLTAGQNAQQAQMMRLLPIFFVVFMIRFPAGLVLYWTVSNVYQFVQQWVMLRGQPQPVVAKRPDRPRARPQHRPQARARPRGGTRKR